MDFLSNLSAELTQEMDNTTGIIQVIHGEVDDRPFWAYVSMYPSTYVQYVQKVEAHEAVNIEEFGIVIAKGWGTTIPQDVQDRMKSQYGADDTLQAQLEKMVQEDFIDLQQKNEK